jgi:hypothetical protein
MLPRGAKDLTLSIEWSPSGVLIATLTGPGSLRGGLVRSKEILNAAATNKTRKILVNCLAVSGKMATLEKFRLATGIVEYFRSLSTPNPAVAMVGTPPTFDGFGVQVAPNLGAFVLSFLDFEKALNWLDTLR